MSTYQVPSYPTRNSGSNFLQPGRPKVNLLETEQGDLIIGGDKDLLISNEDESLSQILLNAIRTPFGVSRAFPNFGSSLRNLIGKKLTGETLDSAQIQLVRDLTNSGFDVIDEKTEVLPWDDATIIVHVVVVNSRGQLIQGNYLFDVLSGDVEVLGGQQV